jgi:hypothetical protein
MRLAHRLTLALLGIALALACGGGPEATEQEPAPTLGALSSTDRFEGVGCSCWDPTGSGQAYLEDSEHQALHVDGKDRELVVVRREEEEGGRRMELTSGAYRIDMHWMSVGETEGGARYETIVEVARGDAPALRTQLSCTCGC